MSLSLLILPKGEIFFLFKVGQTIELDLRLFTKVFSG